MGEAAKVTWADCDFEKKEITVRGDLETGTKNWTIRRVPMIPEMTELLLRGKYTQCPVEDLERAFAAPDLLRLKAFGLRFCHWCRDNAVRVWRCSGYNSSGDLCAGTSDMLFSWFSSCNKHTNNLRIPVREQLASQKRLKRIVAA
jgi:hypothetical protein